MLLSIIIPVYNVEKYIERCILSCLHQNISLASYEIIIVNDGTRDKSLEIVNHICSSVKNNITIINKTNCGLSSARNDGLKIAKGDYIWFVDSDDYIENNVLKYLSEVINYYQPQVVALSTEIISENRKEIKKRKLNQNRILTGAEVYYKSFRYPFSGVQFYLYQAEFLKQNNLKFIEGKLYEDILFSSQILALTTKCIYIDCVAYYYCLRSGSITNSIITRRHCEDLLEICDEMNNIISEQPNNPTGNLILYDSIARVLGVFYHYRWRFLKDKNDKLIVAKKFKSRKYWITAIMKSRKIKYLISYLLIR